MTTPTSFNWEDLLGVAAEAGFTVLPVGEYHVVVDSAEAAKTQNGKDQIKAKFKVASGPYQGKGPIFNNFVISPENANAMSFFFQHLAVFGITDEYLKQNRPTVAQIAGFLVGRQCNVIISHRDWQGQTRMQVDKITKVNPNGVPAAPTVPTAPVAAPAPAAAPAAAPPVAPPVAPAPAPAPVAAPPAAPAAPAAPPAAPAAPSVPAPPAAPAPPGMAPPPAPF